MRRTIAETPPDYDATRIVERPDAFYWLRHRQRQGIRPVPDAARGRERHAVNADTDYEPGETLEEAEAEIGVAEWIDP